MMKKFYFIAFISFILVFQQDIFSQENDSTIFGNWESVKVNSARGWQIIIKSDSSFVLENVLRADYDYRLDGDKLITVLKTDNGKTIIDTSTFVLDKDTLTSVFKKDTSIQITKMVRIDSSKSDSSIVGNWKWRYPNNNVAFSQFTKDGKWLFRLPTGHRNGKCKISKNIIKFIYMEKEVKPDQFNFWVKGNILILTGSNGNQDMYKRVDY